MAASIVRISESRDYTAEVRCGAELLAAGKIVVLPTETVYGAAVLLTHGEARQRLGLLRKGGSPRPLTPHLADRQQAIAFLDAPGPLAQRLMRKLWPGPVGLQFDVTPQRRQEVAASFGVPEAELYDGGSITLRCPDHPVFSAVALTLAAPMLATAAGESVPFDAADLAAKLDGKVDLIFDAGPPRFSKPSTLVKIAGGSYQMVRSGVYDERTIRRLLKTTILFICSGNTCRSAMAQAIARRVLAEQLSVDEEGLEKRGIEVASAGVMAMAGAKATPEAAHAVKALGADLSRHRSRPLTVELVNQADVIYAMTQDHARAVKALVPSAQEKVQTLDPANDIDDPIGGDIELYNDVAARLWTLIDQRMRERTLP